MARTPPRVLIEDWLPIEKVGAESLRDASAAKKPPNSRLHVWWARRPLTVSRAAVLASLLPAWSGEWKGELAKRFPTEDAYRQWFLALIGIFGDPALVRRQILLAKDQKNDLGPNPYGYPRAFTHNPESEDIDLLHGLFAKAWGTPSPTVLDTFAGGGSIPFESMRYGLPSIANELNPVASVILKATLEYPAKFGSEAASLVAKYGKIWAETIEKRLAPFFPRKEGEYVFSYLWARTVTCPYTGKPIPLSPNWWLLKSDREPQAVMPVFPANAREARFRILRGTEECGRFDPDRGTVNRGNGISPWASNQSVDNAYIKAEGEAGRLHEQLYAIGLKRPGGFEFREPTPRDISAVQAAIRQLTRDLPRWDVAGVVPTTPLPMETESWTHGNTLAQFGARSFADLFSPRQLLSLCTAAEVLSDLGRRVGEELAPEMAKAVRTYLGLALDKAADYNSRMARWHSGRAVIANTFDRHEFSFKWSHAEFDAAHNLFPWVVDQVTDALSGISKLASGAGAQTLFSRGRQAEDAEPLAIRQDTPEEETEPLVIRQGSAAELRGIPGGSIPAVVIDPPYYDNVQYSECSDFFYVWQKRTLGDLYPDWFRDELTSKDDEAVANTARFEGLRKKKDLAREDYERKMEACFREIWRVLRDDGVLTVMFTHKKVEAWDTLGSSVINAGFTIRSSWPVHTESEHSLHQAKKNAAASTILLTCRKRRTGGPSSWWDDLKDKVRATAREKAEEYEKAGIRGVDLYLATFGPVLSVISEGWPVLTSEVDAKTGQPRPLRPEAALEIAREEVVQLRMQRLLLGRAVKFDPVSNWYLTAWDTFRAEQFPADEALKLAMAVGVNMETELVAEKKVLSKKGSSVVLHEPKGRRKHGAVDAGLDFFPCTLDAAHTAMFVFEEGGGANACERWLRERGLRGDALLIAFLQGMANAIPNAKKRESGKLVYIRPEMGILDQMNDALRLGIEFPASPAVPEVDAKAVQQVMKDKKGVSYRAAEGEPAYGEIEEE